MADLESMIEGLYDLDRDELRKLAVEALLISDGPDNTFGADKSLFEAAKSGFAVEHITPLEGMFNGYYRFAFTAYVGKENHGT